MKEIGFVGGSQHGRLIRLKYPGARVEFVSALNEPIDQDYSQCDPDAICGPAPKRETYVLFMSNVYILDSLNKHLEAGEE
tara:strand:- start:453 stop:692 length:240 start_codon:yes stop_codon:yes gene_type:complete